MTASTSRGITFTRLAIVTFFLSAGYYFRDAWLPTQHDHAQAASAPLTTSHSLESVDTKAQPDISSESCIDAPGADKV